LSMMTEILLKQAMVGIVGSIGSAIGGAVGGGASASGGMAYSRVSTFSGDYLRVTDNKGKTHDVLTGSDDGRHSNTSLAWGAGVQFNPTESVAIDIAYEGSGSGDWR
ncbi:Ail/Lom family outer membrane beta-barrel protein, partial [Escherichia coli]